MKWRSLDRPVKAPKQLLVEGRTPEIFFRKWVEVVGRSGEVEVRDFGSLDDLSPFLKLFTSYKAFRETVTSLAIIRDAEEKPALSAFESVCAALKSVNLPFPDTMATFSGGTPRTGVFILPDCQHEGMLETVCWSILESDANSTRHLECVEAYLGCLRKCGVEPRNEAKAKVWSYLAGVGQDDPQVGRAAQANVWDCASPALAPLAEFLKAL